MLTKFRRGDTSVAISGLATTTQSTETKMTTQTTNASENITSTAQPVDILVAGSLASDIICDYEPFDKPSTMTSPTLHTSNPARITPSAGGVGRNVALAAHLAGARVSLASVVADDLAGSSLLDHVGECGLSTDNIRRIPAADGARTAQYIAVNDTRKDLVLAMADMSILARPELESLEYWTTTIGQTSPKWVIVDANWSPEILSAIFKAAKVQGAMIAFEPVSIAKAARLFHKSNSAVTSTSVVPNHTVNLASPNSLELSALCNAARDALLFESEQWWKVIDSFGLSGTTSRDRLASIAGPELVEEGIPQQCIQLLPFIPNLVTKLGRRGCLLTSLLRHTDPRLTRPEYAQYILSRTMSDASEIGGVYMRLVPPTCNISQEDIVSVNGVGDTMLGVIVAGFVRGHTLEDVIPVAQDAAVLTLKSPEAVSPEVRSIQGRLQ